MAEPGLFAVPLPFVTALAALAILLGMARIGFGTRASRLAFAALFAVVALQAVLVGLRFGYGVERFTAIQRVLPLFTAPLTWLGFRLVADPRAAWRPSLAHLGAALGLVLLCFAAPFLTDLAIGCSFILYIVLSMRLFVQGPEAFEAVALADVEAVRRWLLAAILVLGFVAIMDGLIALDFALGAGEGVPLLIGVGSLVLIPLLAAAAVLWPRARPASRRDGDGAADGPTALVARIEALLDATALHRDPDLSLSRLARRLGLPAREVSDAVNRARGCNVSQFVNEHRVRDAAAGLAASDVSVAELMAEVGFRSRSNFYREFARVFSMTPAEYRRRAAVQPASKSASSGVVDSTTSARPSAGGSRRST